MADKVELLIEILLDPNARIDERDDAAMDLGKYNDDRALNALISTTLGSNYEEFIMDTCGESIAKIWIKRNQFDVHSYKNMNRIARIEIYKYIKCYKSEWIKEYELEKTADFSD